MEFQGTNGGHQHYGRGVKPCHAAFNVDKLFSAQVGTKACLRHHVIRHFKTGLGGNDRITTMGDVGERSAVNNGRIVF